MPHTGLAVPGDWQAATKELGQAKAAQNRCHVRASRKMCCGVEVPSTQVLLSQKWEERKVKRGPVICPVLHSKITGREDISDVHVDWDTKYIT